MYADWLEEQKDFARAEFIRVQIEGEAIRQARSGDWLTLLNRSEKILRRNSAKWLGRLHGSLRHRIYRRGFLEEASLLATTLLNNSEAFFRLGPVTAIYLRGGMGHLNELSLLPGFARLKLLQLEGNYWTGASQFGTFMHSEAVSNLEWLDLRGNNIGREGVDSLAASPRLLRLATLRLDQCQLSDEALWALAVTPNLPALKTVYLSGNTVDFRRRGARALRERLGEGLLV